MRILLDTSALVKRYTLESGHERVFALSDLASELCVAAHCRVELASALRRRQRDGTLDGLDAERIWARVEAEIAEMTVVPLTADVEGHAVAALLNAPLRASVALHIGSALAARVDLFVTADSLQAESARRRGQATELITPNCAPADTSAPSPRAGAGQWADAWPSDLQPTAVSIPLLHPRTRSVAT
jgi:hypothetical protein